MNKLFKHLKTIRMHRKHVRKMCFKMGLYWQGLTHDLSKYSITEFKIYKFYDGTRSPHQVSREIQGYSPSWIHHYHKNKHHHEYWLDCEDSINFIPIKIPFKYVVEMVCDMIGASKAYFKNAGKIYTDDAPWNYYINSCKGKRVMHEHSIYLLEKLLWNLKELGEKEFVSWYKRNKKHLKKNYDCCSNI